MSAVLRALVMIFALFVAAVGGVVFAALASLVGGLAHGSLDAFAGFALVVWALALIGAQTGTDVLPVLGGFIALLLVLPLIMPGALMALLAEAFGWRSLTAHMVGNAVVAMLTGSALGLSSVLVKAQTVSHAQAQALALMIATGAVIGLIYWVIAGRRASGFLMRSAPPVAPPTLPPR